MLTIIRSNQVETLLRRLADRLTEAPLASPFAQEIVITPSPAMARWIQLGLARERGVAANLEYPLPAAFLWDLGHRLLDDLPDGDPFAPGCMAWRIFALLPDLLPTPEFSTLHHYLDQDSFGLKRWQLAHRIALVFDRYQFYRPDLVRDWTTAVPADWQGLLWRRLLEQAGGPDRIQMTDRLMTKLRGAGPFPGLPERISLFALSQLPPPQVDLMHALATLTQVDMYVHAPTDHFWSDLVSPKQLARKRLASPDQADLWETGNSLLSSWGRQGQALQDLLLAPETPVHDIDAFVEPLADANPDQAAPLLLRLQRDIFKLRQLAAPDQREDLDPQDASIRVQVCHTPIRECQVLHDHLLALLDGDSGLTPEDILVMVPDISGYAPYIEAVFAQDEAQQRPYIPWNLSDISAKDEHPLVRVFLQSLGLPDSRFARSEILSYLDVPELTARFELDQEAVGQIKQWLGQAHLRWGLDGQHKDKLGLPAEDANTWLQAEQRLFAGYALGGGDLFQGIAPIDGVEGSRAEALGRCWHLVNRLRDAATELAAPRSIRVWQRDLTQLLGDLFGERDDEGQLQRIRDALAELADQAEGIEEPLSIALVRAWLGQALERESRQGRYFSGGVTFCGMSPLRSLPFEVICVLGLDDLAFPRRDRLTEFDALRDQWRPGDPRAADEDRYLFLETLLGARRGLYLSYVGRDVRTNLERQPSVLVRELLDYIDQQYRVAGAAPDQRASQHLTQVQPMQPFSPRAFAGGSGSHDGYWCQVARDLQNPQASARIAPIAWPETTLPSPPERMRDVALIQLERFVRHPVRTFVTSRLQVYLGEEEQEDDAEPFSVGGLESFALKQRLVADSLRGRASSSQQLSAEGLLPHGGFARLSFDRHRDTVVPLVEGLAAYQGQVRVPVAVDLRFDGDQGPRSLAGPIQDIYPGLGLLHWKPSGLKGADILALWIQHLAWCTSGAPGPKQSRLQTLNGGLVFAGELAPEEARTYLGQYLAAYWTGLHRPLPVFPKGSHAYALARRKGGDTDACLAAARSQWNGNEHTHLPGDKDDAYLQLVLRHVSGDPVAHPEFAQLAGDFYATALEQGEAL